jgi:hypothetical protein
MAKYPPIVGGVKIDLEKHGSRPFLHVNVRAQTATLWAQQAGIQEKNGRMMINIMRSFLSSIRVFNGHLRMQVHFGTFVFDKFRKLMHNQPMYSFEEFSEMLGDEHAQGRLVPRYVHPLCSCRLPMLIPLD